MVEESQKVIPYEDTLDGLERMATAYHENFAKAISHADGGVNTKEFIDRTGEANRALGAWRAINKVILVLRSKHEG